MVYFKILMRWNMLSVSVEYTENEAGRFYHSFVFADHVCMMCMWWPDYKDDDDDHGNEDIKDEEYWFWCHDDDEECTALTSSFSVANGGAYNVERSQSLCGGKVFSIYSCVSVLLFYCHAVDSWKLAPVGCSWGGAFMRVYYECLVSSIDSSKIQEIKWIVYENQ